MFDMFAAIIKSKEAYLVLQTSSTKQKWTRKKEKQLAVGRGVRGAACDSDSF